MEQKNTKFEDVLTLVKGLTPLEKVHLIESIVPDLEGPLEAAGSSQSVGNATRRSSYGICSDLGTAPSAEDIDETRREIFERFAQDGI